MIIYFADKFLNILGQASTGLPQGVTITDDKKTEDVETGTAIFECDVNFTNITRSKVEAWTQNGNYILRSNGPENEFYTILDTEIDSKKQTVYIYAEDNGLELINEVVGSYEAIQPYPISHYVNRCVTGSGWEIGVNEVEGLTLQLNFDSEETVSARLLKIAEAFANCELSFSFKISGLQITKKLINIYEKRGQDTGVQLRLNKEIDKIITSKSISNLATALKVTGGTPENADNPITLLGYTYDDGDFYIDGEVLKSRKALENWDRYLWRSSNAQQSGGHIVKQFSYDTTSQEVLCAKTIEELKKLREVEINYEIDITKPLENIRIGDRVNIVDDKSELYLSSRILILETEVANQKQTATLGEHLIKGSGISQKVAELAAEFAKQTISVKRAAAIAEAAQQVSQEALETATTAAEEAEAAQIVADSALSSANAATETAASAEAKAQAAEAAVNAVEESVSSIETTVNEAHEAAENAVQAAATATNKANEAAQAAKNAATEAAEAKESADNAEENAESAISKADTAIGTANTAKTTAEAASNTAQAAKLDAEQALEDIADFENQLETVENTMQADYARKTELTEAKEELQSQITQNAGEISSAVTRITEIDETANNAAELAESANATATLAQNQANAATADAEAAQAEATQAKNAATAAQAEANTAKAAAATAQSVAEQAETNLAAARADLETVSSRVDATEEEIEAAQTALEAAQTAAYQAQAEALAAAENAATAQNTANTAVSNAATAQAKANEAAETAALAQQNANEAKGNATEAIEKAEEAKTAAISAQNVANTAKTNADTAQSKANEAAATAAAAQQVADSAEATAEQAAADLAAAQENLEAVVSRVDATAEEVEAAQAAVQTAQAAANLAKQEAETAQATANTAKANAATAQTAANNAKTAADNAQEAADEAQAAADQAQADVNALETRVTTAETKIIQNSNAIELRATKEEVTQTLGGYYTKTQTEAKIQETANSITSSVSSTYATKQEVEIDIDSAQTTADTALETLATAQSTITQLADCIEMLVSTDSNGASLVRQTATGWVFSTGEIQQLLNTTSERLNELVNSFGNINSVVSVLQQTVTDMGIKTDYVNIGTYNGEPCIELGQSGNEYKVLITNTQILFQVGSATPTRIDTDGLISENVTIENEFRQKSEAGYGFFFWSARANGNYGLQWKDFNRNLLKESNNIIINYSDQPNESDRVAAKITVISNNAGNAYQWVTNNLAVPISELAAVNQDFTFSMDIRTTNLTVNGAFIRFDFRTGFYLNEATINIPPNNNGKWQRLSGVFSVTTDPLKDSALVAIYFPANCNGVILEYKNLKLEFGNKASDWSPALEDTQ